MKVAMLQSKRMANVQFDSNNQNNRPQKERSKMVKFIRDKLGVSGAMAKKIFIGIGATALIISLYFWVQLFF